MRMQITRRFLQKFFALRTVASSVLVWVPADTLLQTKAKAGVAGTAGTAGAAGVPIKHTSAAGGQKGAVG